MFLVFKKNKIICFFILVLLLVVYIVLKYSYTNNINGIIETGSQVYSDISENEILPGEAVAVSASGNEFYKVLDNKETSRSKALNILQNIIDNKNSSDEAKKEAENKLIYLTECINNEMIAETILQSKGFENAIVLISDKSVNVIIRNDSGNIEDKAKINDIIYDITGNNNVKIVEVV